MRWWPNRFMGYATNKRFACKVEDFIDFECLSGMQRELEFQGVFLIIQGRRHRFNKANCVQVCFSALVSERGFLGSRK